MVDFRPPLPLLKALPSPIDKVSNHQRCTRVRCSFVDITAAHLNLQHDEGRPVFSLRYSLNPGGVDARVSINDSCTGPG